MPKQIDNTYSRQKKKQLRKKEEYNWKQKKNFDNRQS